MEDRFAETGIEMFFGAIAGGVSGDVAGAVAGATQPLATRAAKAARRRIQQVREVTMHETELTLDEVATWCDESDRHTDFFIRLVEAARREGLEEKRVALGRVAARAFTDRAALDEGFLLLEVLEAIEAPHIRVLGTMAAARPGTGQLEGGSVTGVIGFDELSSLIPDSGPVLHSAVATLIAHGAVADSSPASWEQIEGKERWIVSDFGHQLLDLLMLNDDPA